MARIIILFISLLCISCLEYSPNDGAAEKYTAEKAAEERVQAERSARQAAEIPGERTSRIDRRPAETPQTQMAPVPYAAPKKKQRASKVLQTIAPTLVHARHPEHFFRSVPAIFSVTFGDPLVKELETIEHTDSIPKAISYSVALQGDPPDHFIITPAEQVILAPVPGIPSSTAYFSVIPQSRGQKKLHYFVKAQMTAGGPGIGLPELHKTILVEVNRQSVWISARSLFKEHAGKLFSAIGAAIGAWLLLRIKKWLKLKDTADEDVK